MTCQKFINTDNKHQSTKNTEILGIISKNKIENREQQVELENMIKDLEEENLFLMEEYKRLQNQLISTTSTQILINEQQNIPIQHLMVGEDLYEQKQCLAKQRALSLSLIHISQGIVR